MLLCAIAMSAMALDSAPVMTLQRDGITVRVLAISEDESFEAMKPILYATVNSLRTVPQRFTQQQLVLMEITKHNFINGMEEIAAVVSITIS